MTQPRTGRTLRATLLALTLAFAGLGTAHAADENKADALVTQIQGGISSVQGMIAVASDATKLNCLNTEEANLQGFLADAQGIQTQLAAAIAGNNQDQVEAQEQKIVPLQTNVDSAISRATGCKGATDLTDGNTMSVTVTGGNKDDGGDQGFGTGPQGSTRTLEASPRL